MLSWDLPFAKRSAFVPPAAKEPALADKTADLTEERTDDETCSFASLLRNETNVVDEMRLPRRSSPQCGARCPDLKPISSCPPFLSTL